MQCESANENTELLDSVRFIIQRESEGEREDRPSHIVLLLNLPRGHSFAGYQGNLAIKKERYNQYLIILESLAHSLV